MTESKNKPKSKPWKRWLFAVLLILCLAVFALWIYVKGAVEYKIETQLSALGLGTPKIGSVSVGPNGVTANQIQFFQPDASEPWVSLKQLTIDHPLRGLAAGDEVYEGMEIDGLRAIVDLDLPAQGTPFDFSTIDIPAKQLKLKNAAVTIRQPSRPTAESKPREIVVDQINGSILKTQTGFEIDGTIGDLVGGEWTAVGSVTPSENDWNIKLKSDSARLVDGQWQNWPGLPNSIEKYFGANAEVAANVELSSDEENAISYVAEIDLIETSLNLPQYKLPIEVTEGKLKISDGVVRYENIVASTNGKDTLTGFGSTTVDGFPIRSKFEADFLDLDVATLRKLTSAIPVEVRGTTAGKVSGAVDVEESLRTTIALNADGESSNVSYGSIETETAKVNVAIKPLVFDSRQNPESIEGSVTVDATAVDQSANNIFNSLDLQDLAKQLEVEANASGNFLLELPLGTADKIETWGMKVSATAKSGKFSQQLVRDLSITANLTDGNLHFTEIIGTPVSSGEPDSSAAELQPTNQLTSIPKFRTTVEWPLNSIASPSDVGNLVFTGESVPAQWLVRLIDRQVRNASESNLPQQDRLDNSLGQITGSVNFQSSVTVDANDPAAINKWAGTGSVNDSIAIAAGQRMVDLNSQLKLADGVLKYSQLNGNFSTGGSLNADGEFDIAIGSMKSARVQTTDIPLSWVVAVATESTSDVKAVLKNAGFELDKLDEELTGNLSAQFDLTPPTEGQVWSIATRINSEQLRIKGEPLNKVQLLGNFDANTIAIEKAHAELNGRGQFDLGGTWKIAENSGQADLDWQRLPLNWLASFASSSNDLFAGSTSGNVRVSKNLNAADGAIPITVAGSVNADGLQFVGVKSRQLGFDIRTEGDAILLERFHSEDDLKEVDLNGRLELKQPFAFAVDGTIKQLPLARIFERPSIADQEAMVSITGMADAKVNVQGDLTSLEWGTTGEVKLANLNYNQQPLSEINAAWNHSENDWGKSAVIVNAFGGSMKMVELNQQPQRIKVELKDIDSEELTSLTKSAAKFTGNISGEASLNDWSLAETRWADLNLRGASVLVGPAEFGELQGSVEYRTEQLKYSVEGRLLDGKFTAEGETKVPVDNPLQTRLPVNVQFVNGALNQLYRRSINFKSLRSLRGSLSANADWVFQFDRPPTGTGVVKVNNLSWDGEILTKEITTNVIFNSGSLELSNLRADLQRGEISGRASIPITSNRSGNYQLNFRSFNLQRLLEVVMNNPIKGAGLMDARISGQIGRTVSGQGTIAINRAKILGLAGSTFQVPIQFHYQPQQNVGRIAFRQSRFQVFNGNVSGSASLEFGRRISLNTDLKVAKLDTELLFAALAGFENSGQGDLSGQLVLKGDSVRSLRDLKGSFTGRLDRAAAFELPLLNEVGRFLGGNQLQARDFESNDIDLRLSQGKIEVRRLNFSNSLAQIAVTGDAFVDGRLDLSVAGKIDRLNQPTLIEQLAGSPLSRFQGTPVAFFAQAADFISERLVFVQIGGTFRRPQVRPDSGKQLQSETIRYFLRGSQILPNASTLNN